ncbi:MAG: hypothetical protein IJ717_01115 [Treponema sp.]|nr:hypothetical protein [Treponema sp.]
MKKTLLTLAISLFSLFCFALDKGTQFVLPEKVYVGDTVEIRYLFRSDVNLLSDDVGTDSSRLALSTEFKDFDELSDRCLVKGASIERNASDYTLSLEIVVWKTDFLDFPPFDLASLVRKSLPDGKKPNPGVFWIDLEPIAVDSIAKENGATTFSRHKSPLLLPGTTALIVLLSVLFVSALFLVFFLLMHIPSISDFVSRTLVSATMKKNSRAAVKKLKRLQKKSGSLDDAEFALEFQKILRAFLCSHFKEDFSSSTTYDLSRAFNRIFLDDVPIEFERFVDIFARTDYIRFARGKVDSEFQKDTGVDERASLIDEVVFTISALGREISGDSVPSVSQSGGSL